jgi:hypothetical protein
MAASKAYLQDELSQKIPQKIISHFQITRNIGKDEQILAVFGGAQFMGITSSAVSTKNRLVYLNNAGIAPKQYVIHYADIESITTGSEKNREFITVTPKSGEAIKINIDASDDDTKKFLCVTGEKAMKDAINAGNSYLDIRNIKVARVKEAVKNKIMLFGSQGKA